MAIIVAPATIYEPGTVVTDQVFGDSDQAILNTALGQTFIFNAGAATIYGDALDLLGLARGGNDVFDIFGADSANPTTILGDAGAIIGTAMGGADRIVGKGNVNAVGDALVIAELGVGGNDRLGLAPSTTGFGFGDAVFLFDQAQGGDDLLYGTLLLGDASVLADLSQGGNDRLYSVGQGALMVGDGIEMGDEARGGNDLLVANHIDSILVGDAFSMLHAAVGGDDTLRSNRGKATLYGDAETMSGTAQAGNDALHGGRFADILVGDASEMKEQSSCGDDVLCGAGGNDRLWGDAQLFDSEGARGADRFQFGRNSGRDTIYDFQLGIDVIDVQRLGFTAIGQLSIVENNGESVVAFGGGNQVTLLDVVGLNETDFLFA